MDMNNEQQVFKKWFLDHAKAPIDPWHKEFAWSVWQARSALASAPEAGKWMPATDDDLVALTCKPEYQPKGHTANSYFWFMVDALRESGFEIVKSLPTPPRDGE